MLRNILGISAFLLVAFLLGYSHDRVWARSNGKTLSVAQLRGLQPYMLGDCIISEHEFDNKPYVVEQAGEHLATGNGDRVYVRGVQRVAKAKVYSLFRQGEAYVDPDTKEVLGYLAIHIGEAHMTRRGDPATFKLVEVHREVLVGDRLLLGLYKPTVRFTTHRPRMRINGKIVGIREDLDQTGRYRVVVVNKGIQQGIRAGDTLTIYRNGATIVDSVRKDKNTFVKLPDEPLGDVLIYRTFDRLSFGLVLQVNGPVKLHDWVRS